MFNKNKKRRQGRRIKKVNWMDTSITEATCVPTPNTQHNAAFHAIIYEKALTYLHHAAHFAPTWCRLSAQFKGELSNA